MGVPVPGDLGINKPYMTEQVNMENVEKELEEVLVNWVGFPPDDVPRWVDWDTAITLIKEEVIQPLIEQAKREVAKHLFEYVEGNYSTALMAKELGLSLIDFHQVCHRIAKLWGSEQEKLDKSDSISSVDELEKFYSWYEKYLPDTTQKYPITMRVTKEEEEYILLHRGTMPFKKEVSNG